MIKLVTNDKLESKTYCLKGINNRHSWMSKGAVMRYFNTEFEQDSYVIYEVFLCTKCRKCKKVKLEEITREFH